jgi:hypothetical protein
VRQSVRHSVSQSVIQTVRQPVIQTVIQSVRQSVRQSFSQSVRQSVRHSVSQSVSHQIQHPMDRATSPSALLPNTDTSVSPTARRHSTSSQYKQTNKHDVSLATRCCVQSSRQHLAGRRLNEPNSLGNKLVWVVACCSVGVWKIGRYFMHFISHLFGCGVARG